MEGISLLDNVDATMLAIYCQMLARRDYLQTGYNEYSGVGTLDKQESLILQYAEKLGLTPSGRARLAKERADKNASDPDGDLFGDGS